MEEEDRPYDESKDYVRRPDEVIRERLVEYDYNYPSQYTSPYFTSQPIHETTQFTDVYMEEESDWIYEQMINVCIEESKNTVENTVGDSTENSTENSIEESPRQPTPTIIEVPETPIIKSIAVKLKRLHHIDNDICNKEIYENILTILELYKTNTPFTYLLEQLDTKRVYNLLKSLRFSKEETKIIKEIFGIE